MKKSFSLLFGVSIAIVALVLVALGMYNKPHVDVKSEEATYQIDLGEIIDQYTKNSTAAHEKFGGKVIQISGILQKLTEGVEGRQYVILESGQGLASCEMDEGVHESGQSLTARGTVDIKGICVGFDDLLGELQLKKCSVVLR